MKKWDPCWRLFTYNAILNESRYLSKAVKGIIAAVGSAHHHELDIKTEPNIKTDVGNTSLDVNVSLVDAIRSLVNTIAPPDPGDFGQLLSCLTQLESDVKLLSS